jgi:hypothetical protein
MVFKDFEDAKIFYNRYARHAGFGVRTRKIALAKYV